VFAGAICFSRTQLTSEINKNNLNNITTKYTLTQTDQTKLHHLLEEKQKLMEELETTTRHHND